MYFISRYNDNAINALNKVSKIVLNSYPNIIPWDSHLAAANEYSLICRTAEILNKNLLFPWACKDANHPGLEVSSNAAQSLLFWLNSKEL